MIRRWNGRRPGDHPGARPWFLSFAAAVVALALLAAACGGSDGGGDGDGVASAGGSKSSSKNNARKDPQQAGVDFARCMREHGVDVPDPQGGDGFVKIGPGPSEGGPTAGQPITPPPGFEDAEKACRHFLEDIIGDGAGSISPEEQDRALKFARCMREHGINMPDPDFSKGGVAIQIGEGFDPTSQAVKDAHKACEQFFGPGGGQSAVVPRGGKSS